MKHEIKPNEEVIRLKIKNRNNWFILVLISAITAVMLYSIIDGRISIDSSILLTFLLAFFSIFLSATFYFKATEQSNAFYDRSYSHTKDIHLLLSSMDGKFNKALANIEKGNDILRGKLDDFPLLLEQKNNEIEAKNEEQLKFIDEQILAKINLPANEKDQLITKLGRIENEKSLMKKEMNMLLKQFEKASSYIPKTYTYDEVKKIVRDKGYTWYPGKTHEIIINVGAENITKMSEENLLDLLNGFYKEEFNEMDISSSERIKNAFESAGIYDFKQNSVTEEYVRNVISIAKKLL